MVIPPRHVWDLHANQVVPYWVASEYPWAISHVWVDDNEIKREMTPINGYEWPVPMPKDADLDLIRIELLNLGAKYIWLDMLCLRQEGQEWDRREALRKEEWKLDLPTIGWVYVKADKVVCYLSGLGLPLSFRSDDDFEDDQCWFNRAWTLQETPDKPLIAGKTCDDSVIDERFMTKDMQRRLDDQLEPLLQIQLPRSFAEIGRRLGTDTRFSLLSQMQKRKATNPVDKIAGLVYISGARHIPIYDAEQSEEDAWAELMNVSDDLRAEFFFLYPKPGNRNESWQPTWQQVMEDEFPRPQPGCWGFPRVYWVRKWGDRYLGPRIDTCTVRGLADVSENARHGELTVKKGSRAEYTFEIIADHSYPIPDGVYTLLGSISHFPQERTFWVVGIIEEPEEKFQEVSVFRMADDRKISRLKKLNVYRKTTTWLL
ncbi:hypothetical protein EDD18DRAFT_1084611 [Armillaria luteobubalina]|uniref:Heterokaryon incompatibility domain-containing protein n=1 Tax=Armillaria luteobubalina TaxID=153913 RepID=A0AA39PFF2_9AGAR|nr:hypothetical protein EDD18DRAFT_1084611 [Armillaria luteobubalina]